MFEQITSAMLARMRELEAIDRSDRSDGTLHSSRLRQIPPETGKFIALLAASAPTGSIVEIGTSAGYSTLWLALAARSTGRKITTFEIDAAKVELARATFAAAGVTDLIDLIHADALTHLPGHKDIAFCFLDAEKEIYAPAYELLIPLMAPGAILVADNATSHQSQLRPMLDRALADNRVDAVLVPIGTGDLVCRKK